MAGLLSEGDNMTQPREWWQDDSHPDAKPHRRFLEIAAKEEAQRFLATVPVRKALPPPRPRKKADVKLAQHLGELTAKAIKDATAPLEARIKEIEERPAGLDYKGTYRRDYNYAKNAGVTHSGSLWVALKDKPTKEPGEVNSGWQLAVKKGRDGKDAK
jgi:hypothetical protein